jgi:hypothetical protein
MKATHKFLAEVRKSHTVISYVDVVSPSNETKRLVAIDGSVTVDRTAQFRRSAGIECVDPLGEFIPNGTSGILTPFGTEVRPYRGVKYNDGTVEVYPLGVFRLSRVQMTESSSGAGVRIKLDMFDRARTISRDAFTTMYSIAADTNVIDAVKLIVRRTFPDAEFDAISSPVVTPGPKVYAVKDDPWTACVELAKSAGCEIFFDTEGRVVIAPPIDLDALPSPDFTYIDGAGSTLLDLDVDLADEKVCNGVVVQAQSTSSELPPVRAEAWDNEPLSPTYHLGPYGRVPKFVDDKNVTTEAQAQAMADSLVKGLLGSASQLQVSSWTNPALEAGDVIEVRRDRMRVSGLYTVDSFSVPLRASGTQTLKLRQRRFIDE